MLANPVRQVCKVVVEHNMLNKVCDLHLPYKLKGGRHEEQKKGENHISLVANLR
jgi:hypothetical protein